VGEARKLEKGEGGAGGVIYWRPIMFSTRSPKYARERERILLLPPRATVHNVAMRGEVHEIPASPPHPQPTSSQANSRLVVPLIK
jgi:hypothetical protein